MMSEKILAINEISDEKIDWDTCDGFAILTDRQTIKLLISNEQSCCEDWGYFMSEDNFDEYIGAEVIEISLTNTTLNTRKYEEHIGEYGLDGGDVMFVNIITSNGRLQFVAYNAHNGYYGHSAYVFSEQLTHEEGL
jgi:hypothetical protein